MRDAVLATLYSPRKGTIPPMDRSNHSLKAPTRMCRALHIFLLVALATAWLPALAAAENDGQVSGVVVNGTSNTPLADIEVTLSKFASQSPESEDIRTTTDQDGRFSFANLDTNSGLVYAASARYERVLYSTGMLRLSEEPSLETTLTVFETTRDESVVSVQARGVIITAIDGEEGIVSVADAYILSNPSVLTFIGDEEGRAVRFTVPENTLEVSPLPGYDFSGVSLVDDVIHTSAPLRPGTANATLQYQIPYSDTTLNIPLRADYQTTLLRVLLPVEGSTEGVALQASGATLIDQGLVTIEGREYHVWLAGEQAAGKSLTVSLTNLPRTLVEPNILRTTEPAIIAFLMLAIATGLTGLVIVKRGLHQPRPVTLAPQAAAPLDVRRADLSAKLRDLEESWNAGEVEESAYRVSRKRILEELRLISRQYRGLGEDE
jgi:5-hydroxyisourate hydrolase-like protein (transthyretin family)